MKNPYKIEANSFLLWWVAGSVIVYPITAMALGIVLFPLGLIFESLAPREIVNSSYDSFYTYSMITPLAVWVGAIVGVLIAGAIIGLALAQLQRRYLRNRLFWAADKWRGATIIGSIIGAYLAIGMVYYTNNMLYISSDTTLLWLMTLFITPVGIAQSFALRDAVKQPYLWALANTVGGIVFGGVLVMNQPSYSSSNSDMVWLGMIALAVLGQGFITGIVALFLFEKKSLLPTRYEEDERPKSVWDKAI